MQADVIRRLHAALPQIRTWIDQLLVTHAGSALKLEISRLPYLAAAYPADLLERARMVLVDRTPFPPVTQFGLPEFAQHENRSFDGITFKNTFFVVRGSDSAALQFHELVHVVQWNRLGVDNFLLAYGLGLLQFRYEQSPLEQMAYSLQDQFVRGGLPKDLVRVIEERTDAIWKQVAPIVRA